MVLESNGYGGVRECSAGLPTVAQAPGSQESNGYGVKKLRLWCWRVTVMVLESYACGVGE
jgi:hypothetical protein